MATMTPTLATLCWGNTCCPPGTATPPLRADCVDDGYEELPVSVPPHVPQGLSRNAPVPGAGREGGAYVVEPPHADGGVGAGSWLALVCVSAYGKVADQFRSS
ncbi:hypothetical protein QOZ80_1BG0054230 [Eleusine coracana subsp. coracana]|nr:hypothetical protein QOZ80_1BG0054230 [Eleusine coracana subsp. coracana]